MKEGVLAVINGENVSVYDERGIKTLLDILMSSPALLEGAIVADKVVGKAAALLMVKGGVKEVYAETVSESALEVFRSHQIPATFGTCVLKIMNRAGTGPCPMESAVAEINDPQTAFEALKQKVYG